MAQKSLPIVNKVNTSMIWYSTYYFKYYKWMSSQYLYLLYFFNKLFIYLDLFFFNCLWFKPHTTYMYVSVKKPSFLKLKKIKFFKPVTSYLVNLGTRCIIFNLYYKTTLAQLQSLTEKTEETTHFAWEEGNMQNLEKIFFT